MMSILKGLWSMEVVSLIREIGDNMYSFSFKMKCLMKKALEEGPWSIMGHCMVLKKWKEDTIVKELEFNEVRFWIQVHNIPLKLLTKWNLEVIRRKIWKVVEVKDPSGSLGIRWGFLRIRVGIRIENALLDGFWIPIRDNRRI